MFKRRRPDEAPVTDKDAGTANPIFEAPKAAASAAPAPPALSATGAPAAAAVQPARADGLGVPPFRPTLTKEAALMSRPPVPAAPTPGLAPQPASLTPPPRSGATAASLATSGVRPQTSERRTLVVGRGISVQGSVQDAERLVVEGTVEATNIRAQELSVAPGGVFRGEIEVEEAELAGTIDGTLVAHGTLVVRSSGKLLGAARCRRLQVEDGGQISGRIEMLTENAPRDLTRPAIELARPSDRPAPVPPAPAEVAAG